MSDKTKTVNEMIGEKAREIEGLKAQMRAYAEPIKDRVRSLRGEIERLVLEDGGQLVAADLLQGVDDE